MHHHNLPIMKKCFLIALFAASLNTAFTQIDCINDSESPTASFISLSSSIVQNGTVNLSALDFMKTYSDNCTPSDKLLFTFYGAYPVQSKLDEEHYFKSNGYEASYDEFFSGRAQQWLPKYKSSNINVLTCLSQMEVSMKISVWDQKKNMTTGTSTLTVIDNNPRDCNYIKNFVVNTKGEPIHNFAVIWKANLAEFPLFFNHIDSVLLYNHRSLDTIKVSVTITKADDLMNGVSSKDVIAIHKHILGIKKLDTPYKLLAADINGDYKITASDLFLAKKIAAGLIDKIPLDSWLFINRDFVFKDPKNPWFDKDQWTKMDSFLMNKNVNVDMHFIGIKIGDVDGNAKP